MKRDQYIPHEVSMRNTSEVMNLIEKEGMEGYGIYWALMEYVFISKIKRFDVLIKTPKRFTSNVEVLEKFF